MGGFFTWSHCDLCVYVEHMLGCWMVIYWLMSYKSVPLWDFNPSLNPIMYKRVFRQHSCFCFIPLVTYLIYWINIVLSLYLFHWKFTYITEYILYWVCTYSTEYILYRECTYSTEYLFYWEFNYSTEYILYRECIYSTENIYCTENVPILHTVLSTDILSEIYACSTENVAILQNTYLMNTYCTENFTDIVPILLFFLHFYSNLKSVQTFECAVLHYLEK